VRFNELIEKRFETIKLKLRKKLESFYDEQTRQDKDLDLENYFKFEIDLDSLRKFLDDCIDVEVNYTNPEAIKVIDSHILQLNHFLGDSSSLFNVYKNLKMVSTL